MTGTEHRDPPSANQDAVTSTRAHLKALPQRLMPRVDAALDRRWARGLLVVAFVVPLAFLLGPSFSQRPGDVASHLKVGARAETNIKATRDFDYQPGLERLEEQRREAAKAVLPVFDYHTDQGAILLSRVSDAFRTMAGAFAAAQKKEGGTPAVKGGVKDARGRATQGKLPHALATGGKLPRGKTSKRPSASSAKPGAPGAVLEDPKTVDDDALRKRFSNLLQSDVSDDVFRCLRKARFSADVRAAIVVLVASAMDQMVVSHRGVLSPFAGKPVTVRRLVGGRPGTRGDEKLASFNVIKDLLQIKEQVRHQANVHGSKLDPKLRGAVVALVDGLVVPNLIFDPAETTRRKEAAQDQIRPRSLHFVKGQVLIRDGDPITKKNARIVAAMARTYEGVSAIQVIFGVGLFALVLLVTVYRFASDQFERFSVSPRDLLMMGTLLVGMLALTRGVSGLVGAKHLGLTTYLLPVAGGAMLVRLLVSAEVAAFFAVVVAGLVGLSMDRSLELTFFYLVTGLVASFGVLRVQSRSTLLRAGLMAGLAGAATVFSLQLFGGQLVVKTLILSSLAAVAGGLLVAFAVLALLPAIEWLFAYTTDISLLELANLNHPLLRELMLRAPGTYHHSMVVGNLAEAGCEAIGANGLRARVAAYYHDVGKMKNAAYFAENFHSGDNPHSRLKASMSALIIRSHIKDGIEMMREHGIPEPIIETASQHHGTALISFFYHKAIEQKDEEEEVLEADYRYPGPKPQSREAGVIMVADGVEAAARSLGEPSDDRLQAVAQRIINTQFTDGQLDQCDLTLRDLHMIAKSFLQVLSGIYHARPTYPWQRRDDTRGRKRETLRHKGLDRGDVTPSDAEGAAKTGGEDR
ncbi:MAG: HDIG domain-containing protein, partial [Deltaproteobacteria bacterium]|nr:HDIG domain-containing protein [Deltaproteobacteria bacterium]